MFAVYYMLSIKKLFSYGIVSCLFFLLSLTVNAQSDAVRVFKCADDEMGAVPAQYIYIIEDTANVLSFDEVVRFEPSRFLSFADVKKKLHRHTNYWVRVDFKNLRGVHTLWMMQLGLSRFSDVYIPNSNGVYSKSQYGYNWPDAQKLYSEILWDVVGVPMDPLETKTIYFRFHSDLNIGVKPLIKVISYQELKEDTLKINLLQGVFHGLVLMMMLYSLFMFVSLRDRAFLYYVLYVGTISFSMLILVGYVRYYILPQTGCNPLNSELVIQYMGVIYLLFFRKFADLKQISKAAFRYINVLITISILLATSVTIVWFNNFYAFNLFAQISSLFELVTLGSVIVICFIHSNKIIRYFLVGSFCFTIGATVILVGILFFRIPFAHLLPFFQIGVVCELFLFSIGLSQRYKYNEEQRKLAQDRLIAELQTREAYQQQLNEALEQKVKERTAEILQQNEEIMVQRDHIESQKNIIEQANNQLVDSIQYARFIQKSIFHDKAEILSRFKDAFIWLRPHSMVSGDFYWWHSINEHSHILAVADCTGHGVPGAMMTIVANGMLDEIVCYQKLHRPDQILYALEANVSARFNTSESQAQSSNGLDIGVVLIDYAANMLYFAGAKIPLYYVVDGVLQKLKADMYGIGSYVSTKKKTFELQQLPLSNASAYYLCSDGIQDQFGGPLNKKFSSQRLSDLFLQNHALPMAEQHKNIESNFDAWKLGAAQTDDVVLVGFRP